MLYSMTGFGKASGEYQGRKISVEIRSLNSRQLDLSFRIPARYKQGEMELRADLAKALERGKADVSILFSDPAATSMPVINKELAKQYYRELKSLAGKLGIDPPDYLPVIMRMPEVVQSGGDREDLSAEEWKTVKSLVLSAAGELRKFRAAEGASLASVLTESVEVIKKKLEETAVLDIQRIPALKEKLRKNLSDISVKGSFDENRMEQEMIYYIEKIDITEEKVRLRTHCDYFIATMPEPSGGRKLGFICQEIGREINTIGSKANDAGIQKLVVLMKDELEKIKEQLLNIL